MKPIKFAIIIALCSALFCGCAKKTAAPPHLVAVPKNAALVLSLNAKQIVEKAGLNNLNQFKAYSLLKQALENDFDKSTKMIKDFLENTRNSGLNLDHIFVYLLTSGADKSISCGVTFLIDDEKVFENLLKEITWLDVDTNNKTVVVDDELILRWNDEIAVISVNAGNNDVDIFNTDESESIVADELFLSEYSGKNDAHLYMKQDVLFTTLNDIYYAGYMSKQIDRHKDLWLSVNFNAEKGEFVVAGKTLPAEKASELFEKFYKTDFNDDLYNYFPDKNLLALKFAIKPLEFYSEYLDAFSEYKKFFDATGANHKMKIPAYDEKITAICSYFTGDVLGSLSGINFTNIPGFALAAGVVDGKENEVIALLEEEGMVKNQAGYYSKSKGGFNFYFAVNKNIAFFTSDPESIAKFMDSGYTPNITSAKDFGKELKAAIAYFYVNLNINDYPSIVKPGIASLSREMRTFMPLIEKLKSINVSATSTSFECKLKLTDNDYASKVLVKTLDELLATNMDIFF
jgi:hypothetical protein